MEDIKLIENMINHLRTLKSDIQKKEKLSTKLRDTQLCDVSPKRIEKMNTDLNWQCMNIDKKKTDIARLFKGSMLDVSTDEKEYNPSGWHNYKH